LLIQQDASFLKTFCLEGTVTSGKGEGAKFTKLSWVKEQLEQELGFVPYPGTLDVRITEKDVKRKKAFAQGRGVQILPAPGFCNGRCFKATIKTEPNCAVIIPEVAGYPENLIELISPENLRKKLHLRDGDPVEVEIML
jgi:riboflavin kinase